MTVVQGGIQPRPNRILYKGVAWLKLPSLEWRAAEEPILLKGSFPIQYEIPL